MFPLLLQSSDGSWSIASYPVFLICGWLCAAWYVRVYSTRSKFDHPRKFQWFWAAAFFSWLGGRFFWVSFHHETFVQGASIFLWDAGQSSSWAELWILVIVSVLGCIKARVAALRWLDCMVPTWLIVQVFERLGAFFSGGDFGLVTDSFWGIQFPKGSPADQFHRNKMIGVVISEHASLAVHPVQLYGVLTMTAMVMIVCYLQFRSTLPGAIPSGSNQPGTIFKVSMLGYAISRLLFEDPFKLDRSPNVLGPIRGDQFMSMAVIVAMLLALRGSLRKTVRRSKYSAAPDRISRSPK